MTRRRPRCLRNVAYRVLHRIILERGLDSIREARALAGAGA
jgi:hypothetical protein